MRSPILKSSGANQQRTPLFCKWSVETFGKDVILARIADEAGVELERLAKERREVLDQCVWQATAPEKGQRERSGFREGAMVEDTGANVVTGL